MDGLKEWIDRRRNDGKRKAKIAKVTEWAMFDLETNLAENWFCSDNQFHLWWWWGGVAGRDKRPPRILVWNRNFK